MPSRPHRPTVPPLRRAAQLLTACVVAWGVTACAAGEVGNQGAEPGGGPPSSGPTNPGSGGAWDGGLPTFDAGVLLVVDAETLTPVTHDAATPPPGDDAATLGPADSGATSPPSTPGAPADAATPAEDSATPPSSPPSTPDAASPPADAAGDDAAAPNDAASDGPGPGISASLSLTSTWDNGYCASVLVTNLDDVAVAWTVEVEEDGTMTSFWDSVVTDTGTLWIFQGASWNAVLDPGANTTFGFCVTD